MTTEATTENEDAKKPKEFAITVNDDPVILTEHRLDGAQIKAAAIGAGVPIQQDFVLSRVLPDGKQKVIRDDEVIDVKAGEQFWAIPGDDNS